MGTFTMGLPKLGRYHLLESISSRTFTPREYQVELLDAAKNKNTIICLGTGAGKTFVAVMLIKELAYQTRLPFEEGGKRTVFLVPTAPLSYQQAKVIQDYTDLRVVKLCGSESIENLDSVMKAVTMNEVIISTPDIFKMLLLHGYLPVSKINLLIFDECHRAVRNHAYCEIMKCFDVCDIDSQPRVLGLSASLVNNKCKPTSLGQQIRSLERTLKSTVETASALTMLSKYGSRPQEYLVQYKRYLITSKQFSAVLALINEALVFVDDLNLPEEFENFNHPCKQARRYLVELSHVILTLGPWCTWQASLLFAKEICSKLESITFDLHRIYFCFILTVLNQVAALCGKLFAEKEGVDKLFVDVPPKMEELLKLLHRYKPDELPKADAEDSVEKVTEKVESEAVQRKSNIREKLCTSRDKRRMFNDHLAHNEDAKSLCGLVFVRQRITAYLLNLWLAELSRHDKEYKFISCTYIIGHGKTNSASKDVTLESHKQEEVLKKFKAREYNLIVTTAVAEEGLDIPKCNLVIRFDTPESFCAYLQSKGRARATDSLYAIMICSDEKQKFIDDLCDYKTIEQILLERSHKSDISDEEVPDQQADVLMEPYMPVKEDGAPRVTMSSAIALVNRYCAKLPSDTFTRLTPKWEVKEKCLENKNFMYQCCVQLPINSPLKKPIIGEYMRSKQLSKMAVALKTCKELHQIGELDDNLLPTGKEAVKLDDDWQDSHFEEVPQFSARPGTTKRRQYYFKQVAEALNSKPEAGKPSFLYMFRMVLTCPIPEEQNTRGRKIHDPATSTQGFGIVLNKEIPPICSFPVFTRSGEVTIYLDHLLSNVFLNEEQLEQLSFFHRYTFSDVLRLEKYPMLFSPSESEFSFFVVPVNKSAGSEEYNIDWEFISAINKQKNIKPRKSTEEDRKSFTFKEQDYIDAVVMPWYRNLDKPQFFYVAEICSSLSPLSSFPDEGFGTFKGYYERKYNIMIVNTEQPLLDVDHTSARLNLLTPRYVNRKGVTLPTSSENTKKTKRENLQQKQILIPELCIIHPFPASLWRKAVCLPCVLYRTNSLLLAEQLRSTVARTISVGLSHLPNGFQWPMLDFGWTLADVIKAQAALKDNEAPAAKEKQCNSKSFEQHDMYNGTNNNSFLLYEDSNSSAKNESFVPASDFEIDVFDPSKCVIPDDDALLDEEISNINFGMDIPILCGSSSAIPLWQAPEDSGMPDDQQRIRYGSPSNFENTQWDFEWDVQEAENTNFFQLNLPGLGYISAPGMFNMESLSLDLAAQRDEDDLWDSLDESSLSDGCDDRELIIENNFYIQDYNVEEVCHSEWLSTCSIQPSVQDDDLELEKTEYDDSILNAVASIKRNKINDIKFLNETEFDQFCTDYKEKIGKDYYKILSAAQQIETYHGSVNHSKSEVLPVHKTELLPNNIKPENKDSTLAFGELLPNRDDHDEINCNTSERFKRIHFDECPDLSIHPGPSPSIILQAFTMSNANDGINLERLETVGDSFLKYAITAFLFCTYPNIHEGKLSFLRSKQISNLNLYRLGKKKGLGELMVATKFEPNDNWLPPCYTVPKGLEQALIESGLPISQWNISNMNNLTHMNEEEIRQLVMEKKDNTEAAQALAQAESQNSAPLVPYNLLTQHSIPDKSIADCVEALIGAYLVSCGSRGALLFMSWLGLHVLPTIKTTENGVQSVKFGFLDPPPTPLLSHVSNADAKMEILLSGYAAFEQKIGYVFKDKSYLLQAFTHASYSYNTLTDCYQRLEFLGDAVLDYLITRHLYEDPKKHSPGTLTDLRSALVNNTFFASLAVKYGFHKYFKAISPSLFSVINRFVELKESAAIEDYAESYYLEEEECEEVEEVEVPKALGDIFESVAGALYLDSGMSLDTVWEVYYAMMKPEIEYFSCHVPKSPIRELLELEPQTAKFEKAEMTLSGKVRVRVEVFGKGHFIGIGRNKRIAKCTAAKRALRELKRLRNMKDPNGTK